MGQAYVVLNCYDMLYIMDKFDPESSPVHTVNFGGICPTCHAGQQVNFTTLPPSASDHDYAVGLATGELLSFSMRHHVKHNLGGALGGKLYGAGGDESPKPSVFSSKQAGSTAKVKITCVQYYNRDRAADTGRCTAISWSPRSVSSANPASATDSARVLVAAFADGSLHVYSPNGGILSNHSGALAGDPQKSPSTPKKHREGKNGTPTSDGKDVGGSGSNTSTSGGSSFFSSLRRNKTDGANGSGSGDRSGNGGEGKDHPHLSQPGTPRGRKESKGDPDASGAALLVVQWNVCDCALNSVAFSNDGYQLACVSCDGVLRIFDVGSGTLRAGCRSYFGGYLSVAWSQDGRFVVCGGEDDLVEIFSIADKAIVAFGEGHASWVSDLCFLSVTEQQTEGGDGLDGHENDEDDEEEREGGAQDEDMAAERSVRTRVYKFVSVGQDTQLALWEFEAPEFADPATPRHRRWISTGGTNSTPMKIPTSLQELSLDDPGSAVLGAGGQTGMQSLIAESVPRAHMEMIPSVAQQEAHNEPLSSVLKCKDGIITLCYGGILKLWRAEA